jgi:hypothetical protein
MEAFNLINGETDIEPDGTEPPGYRCRAARLGPKLGASRLGMRPTVRTPEGERLLEPGEVVCFPAGPDGAHRVRNEGAELTRVGLVSTKNEFGIADYPDSDKVGVWAGDAHYMLRRSAHLDYWDGER